MGSKDKALTNITRMYMPMDGDWANSLPPLHRLRRPSRSPHFAVSGGANYRHTEEMKDAI